MSHNTSSKSTVSMDPSSLSSWTGQKVGREKKRYSVRIFHLNINFPHIINIQGGDIKHPILFTIAINSFNCIDYAPFLTITRSEQRKANAWQPRGSTRKKNGKMTSATHGYDGVFRCSHDEPFLFTGQTLSSARSKWIWRWPLSVLALSFYEG